MRINTITYGDGGLVSATDVIPHVGLVAELMKSHNDLVGYVHPTVGDRWMVVALGSGFMAIGADGYILTFTLERVEDGEFYCFSSARDRLVWMMEEL